VTHAPLHHAGLLDALRQHARDTPERPALIDVHAGAQGHVARSWSQLSDDAQRAGEQLARATSHAAPAHAPCALLRAHSARDVAPWVLGALRAGVRVVLLHERCAPAEVGAIAQRAGACAYIDATCSPPIFTSLPAPDGTPRLPHLSSGAVVLASSGTTGLPKLALRTGASLHADGAGIAGWLRNVSAITRLLVPVPLCHSYGLDMLATSILTGATLVRLPGLDAPACALWLGDGQPSALAGVPALYEALARHPGRAHPGTVAWSAGSTLAPAVAQAFASAWHLACTPLYGATELGTVVIGAPGQIGGALGPPLPGVDIRIASESTPPGPGEVLVRAPSMMAGYLDGPALIADGFFATGDLGHLDGAGHLHLSGRLKLLIDVGGLKVNPLEVEEALNLHPLVHASLVFGVAASATVARLRAHVQLRPHATRSEQLEADLRAWLRQRLSPVKVPRSIVVVDALPRTPTGKLLRPHAPTMQP
jgi:long-chain acyl-CoA synthetase